MTGLESVAGSARPSPAVRPRFLTSIARRPEDGTQQASSAGFGELLQRALHEVDQAQKAADIAARDLAAGEAVELHDVMVAAERAALTLELSLAVQNKVIEAYQDISRMQL